MTWQEIGDKIKEMVAPTPTSIEIVSQLVIPHGAKPGINTPAQAKLNTEAFRKTLAKYGRMDVLPGYYVQENDLRVASGNEINGLGNEWNGVTLGLVPGSKALADRGSNGEWFAHIQTNVGGASNPRVGDTFGQATGPSHGVKISNLTLDCGFDNQLKSQQGFKLTTTQGISIEGMSAEIRNVRVIGSGRGLGGGECFPIRVVAPQSKFYDDFPTVIDGCLVTAPGSADQTHNGGGGFEITCITVAGSPANMIEAPLITNCRVLNMPRSANQPSPVQAFHTAYSIGAEIRGNTVMNVDGCGYYVDTGNSKFTRITGNQFINVHRGVFLNGVTDFLLTDMEISDNLIVLSETQPAWMLNTTPAGVVIQRTGSAQESFNGIRVSRNTIIGRKGGFKGVGTLGWYPRGIHFRFDNKDAAQNISAFGNIIDFPSFDTNEYYVQKQDSLAMYFETVSAWDAKNPMVKMWDNRNPRGDLLLMTVVNEQRKPVTV